MEDMHVWWSSGLSILGEKEDSSNTLSAKLEVERSPLLLESFSVLINGPRASENTGGSQEGSNEAGRPTFEAKFP